MASPSSSLALLLLATATVLCAANYPLYDYTYFCDQTRYQKLGLDMFKFPFCDKTLSFAVRAKNLVDLMTLEEKAAQMGNNAPGVARLGIPPYNWWSEALHGVSDVGGGSVFGAIVPGATSFATPIVSAASFNESLWKAIGEAVSTEARVMHKNGVGGVTFWSPNINVVRDPRWGRILETPGEDPFVVGRYAVNYVRGLQDIKGQEVTDDLDTRPLKVSACCKHYSAYDVDAWYAPGNSFVDRFHFSANVTEQDMVETFLRPFEMCVKDGDVSSVMCSYNEVNGIPTCTDARLLRGTVRSEWKLHGYIVADCDSIETLVSSEKFLGDSPIDGVAQVIHGGLNLDCMYYYPRFLANATLEGRVKESDIDESLIKNYIVLLRLGLFDGQPLFDHLTAADVCSPEHIELARDGARQGLVLLKNNNGVLPLNTTNHANIAVVGPLAEATHVMLGNYEGKPCNVVSPLEGLKGFAKNVVTQPGCLDVACSNLTYIFPAVRVVKDAEATIIVTGLDRSIEEESRDRSNLDLPGYQKLFIQQVAAASPGPVVLVVFSAGGVDIDEFKNSNDIDAIIWAGYPGEQGGNAIADVIYGTYNPAGRLPITWYPANYVFQLPMTSMQLRPKDELGFPGRTYKFYNGSTIYPFGYGLSYTQFGYEVVSTQKYVEKSLPGVAHCHQLTYNQTAYVPPCQAALVTDLTCADTDITIDVNVTNIGTVDGSEVVILYSRAPAGIIGAPLKQVVGFQRVAVPAGQSVTAHFTLDACKALRIVTDSAYEVVPAGEHTITVGSGSNAVDFPFHVYLKSELSDLSY